VTDPIDVAQIALRHAARQRRIAATATAASVRDWRRIDGQHIDSSFLAVAPHILTALTAGQSAAATGAGQYVTNALHAQGDTIPAEGILRPTAFAGTSADGRPLESMLRLPVIQTKQAIADGQPVHAALKTGERLLSLLVDTEVSDAGRAAESVAMHTHRSVRGYVRMVSSGACARCALLAGKEYAINRGFARHPHCHCVHVPVSHMGRHPAHTTDPRDYFKNLTPAEQSRIFTNAGAQAIRDGADIWAVVNARRGISTVGSRVIDGVTHRGRIVRPTAFGRKISATTEGMTRRGLPGKRLRGQLAQKATGRGASQVVRLTPEAIYRLASDRDEVLRLLRRFGYLY
jgi:hypothetical protein